MKVHLGGRLFLAAAVLGAVGLMTAGFFAALAVRSALADPGGPVPNPGHAWSELQDHGVSGSDYWLGTTDNNALELRVNGSRALRLEPNATSPNVIGGASDNAVIDGAMGATIGGGGQVDAPNRVTDSQGTVGGGRNNQAGNADGDAGNAGAATVGGGAGNTASNLYATVGGGQWNAANGPFSTVGGGKSNWASADYATVGGGGESTPGNEDTGNRASDNYCTIGGGGDNQAGNADGDTTNATYATVGGGSANTASGAYSTVGGGMYNEAAASYATIAGGGWSTPSSPSTANRVTDDYGTVGGGGRNTAGTADGNTTNQTYATVGGGYYNQATAEYATVAGGYNNRATAEHATVAGGYNNQATDDSATVAGGFSNQATGVGAFVGGGMQNHAIGDYYATVAGGADNEATDYYATVGGGLDNHADGYAATVAGGLGNDATGDHSFVGSGWENTASGDRAVIPGGLESTAAGDYSFAAGRRANAQNDGCFVWADSVDAAYNCTANNKFMARATGGVVFHTSSDLTDWVRIYDDGSDLIATSTGAHLTLAGFWTNNSDAATKENFTPVDGQAVLASLAEMPITTWNSKAEDPSIRHMGPVAQDFSAAFGLGESDTSIGTADADGVALAAIQGLYGMVQDLQAENADLKAQLSDVEARVTALEGGAPLDRASAGPLASMMPGGWLLLAGLVVGGLVLAQRRLAGGRS